MEVTLTETDRVFWLALAERERKRLGKSQAQDQLMLRLKIDLCDKLITNLAPPEQG